MLEALVKGVKGGVWYSLIDKIQRPETLNAAWIAVKRNGVIAGLTRTLGLMDFLAL
jgi:RNA-directed DNA polymerase